MELSRIKFAGEFAKPLEPRSCDARHIQATNRIDERWGIWSDQTLRHFTEMVHDLAGDFAEIGVATGATFTRLVPLAWAQGKLAHAFDSFRGMIAPGRYDRQEVGEGALVEGQYGVGGAEAFRAMMDTRDIDPKDYRLWEGYIPECFHRYDGAGRFSFSIVDVGHYEPTRMALEWIWPRTPPDGLMLVGEFAIGWDMEASRAVKEFLRAQNDFDLIDYYNNQIVFRKIAV